MFNNFKNKNGITLIALVVTIIVLLILAGISISMLTGDNSILNRTTQAKEKTEKAQIIEQARIDILDKKTQNRGSLSSDELEEILTSANYSTQGTLSDNGEESILEKILTTSDGKYSIPVSEIYNDAFNDELKRKEEKIRTQIGDRVNFVSKEDSTLIWRLFYIDKDYVYLISSTSDGKNVIDPYIIQPYLANYSNGLESIDRNLRFLNQTFFDQWGEENCTYATAKATAHLMDQSVWGKYKDNSGHAKYILGCPTLELIINSLNMARGTSYQFQCTKIGYKYEYDCDYGSVPSNWNNGIYTGNRYGWLASPFDGNHTENSLKYYRMCQVYNQSISHDAFSSWGAIDTNYVGLRPIAMIPKETFLNANYKIGEENTNN
jgi:Tfp pilus assembly protein PilE